MYNKLPDFIIIGAAKAGTSSLYMYLNEHPQVFMSPVKETNFFAYEGRNTKNFLGKRATVHFPVKNLTQYRALFSEAVDDQQLGEASPLYLESPVAAKKIKAVLPEVKLIASLRNPVDRAFSSYSTAVRHGVKKPEDIIKALDKSSHYVQSGFYHEKLLKYYECFEADQIKVCLLDDLKENSLSVVKDLYKFLCIDTSFSPHVNVRHNVGGGLPKMFWLSQFLRLLRKFSHDPRIRRTIPDSLIRMGNWVQIKNCGSTIEFPLKLKKHLHRLYKNDILEVQDLIQRDLSSWMQIQ